MELLAELLHNWIYRGFVRGSVFLLCTSGGERRGREAFKAKREPITMGLNCFFPQKNICYSSSAGTAGWVWLQLRLEQHKKQNICFFQCRPLLCWTPPPAKWPSSPAPQCFCSLCLFAASVQLKNNCRSVFGVAVCHLITPRLRHWRQEDR